MKYGILLVVFLAFAGNSLFGQQYFNAGISGVFFEQPKLFGFQISNAIELKKNLHSFEFGLNFAHSYGNKNIDFEKYDKYNIEHDDYSTDYPLFPWKGSQLDLSVRGKDHTSSASQFTFSVGYKHSFTINKFKFNLGGGLYTSYVSTFYYIGTFEDVTIDMWGVKGDGYDIAFFVSLRYINIGVLANMEFELFKINKQPVYMELSYYYGNNQTGLISLGIAVPFELKKAQNP